MTDCLGACTPMTLQRFILTSLIHPHCSSSSYLVAKSTLESKPSPAFPLIYASLIHPVPLHTPLSSQPTPYQPLPLLSPPSSLPSFLPSPLPQKKYLLPPHTPFLNNQNQALIQDGNLSLSYFSLLASRCRATAFSDI